MGLKVGEVKLEEYNSNWEEMFLKEKELLEEKFKDVALSIEHVGSTAVKGLSAKPIIDIAIGLNRLDDFSKVKDNFINDVNYSIKVDSDEGEILIRKGNEDNRTHFIHVMEISSDRYKNTILFRNYLQKNIETLKKYGNLKKELANKYADNRKEYTKAKNAFINEIIVKAKQNLKITYVTGNWAKIDSARQILEPLGYEIDNIKMDTLEIQADTTEEVAIYSAKWASEKLKCDVLKNDSGLYVEALNGFPGVYTHYVDDTLGEDGLLKLLEGVENRKAYFKEVLAYCEYGKDPIIFIGITPGTIATEKSGSYGWSWDFIFVPDGQDKTLGCYPDKERWKFWSLESYEKLAKYLDSKEN